VAPSQEGTCNDEYESRHLVGLSIVSPPMNARRWSSDRRFRAPAVHRRRSRPHRRRAAWHGLRPLRRDRGHRVSRPQPVEGRAQRGAAPKAALCPSSSEVRALNAPGPPCRAAWEGALSALAGSGQRTVVAGTSVDDPGCVKTHTEKRCRKFNPPRSPRLRRSLKNRLLMCFNPRQIFYTRYDGLSFHTAKTRSGLSAMHRVVWIIRYNPRSPPGEAFRG
jgi:hypothetical protein